MGSNHISVYLVLLKKDNNILYLSSNSSDCLIFPILLIISGLRIWNLRGGEGKIPQYEKLCQTILEK